MDVQGSLSALSLNRCFAIFGVFVVCFVHRLQSLQYSEQLCTSMIPDVIVEGDFQTTAPRTTDHLYRINATSYSNRYYRPGKSLTGKTNTAVTRPAVTQHPALCENKRTIVEDVKQ